MALANSAQQIQWYYVRSPDTNTWFAVHEGSSSVFKLEVADSITVGFRWKVVSDPESGASMHPVIEGHRIKFDLNGSLDPDVRALSSDARVIDWYSILNQQNGLWYIIGRDESVMVLRRDSLDLGSVIRWQPISVASNGATRVYTAVNVSADDNTIFFGSVR